MTSAINYKKQLNVNVFGPESPKDTILCLHGGPGMDGSYFLPYLLPLANKSRLAVFDQGQGTQLTMPGLVNEVHEAISLFKGAPIFLMGHSFGAALALEYIKQYGENELSGLILVSWLYDKHWGELVSLRLGDRIKAADNCVDQRIFGTKLSPNDEFRARMVEYSGLYFSSAFEECGKRVLGKVQYNRALANSLNQEYLSSFDLKATISDLTLPTISITGDVDIATPLDYVLTGCQQNSSICSQIIKGVAHFPFIENPDLFMQIVKEFVTKERK